MENTSAGKIIFFVTVSNWICVFFGILFAFLQTKTAAASVPHPPQRKRLTVATWMVLICFIGAVSGHVLLAGPWIVAEALGASMREATPPCPSSPTGQPEAGSSPERKEPSRPAPVERVGKSESPGGVNFSIDGIRYDYSRNALMGRFAGRYQVEPEKIKFSLVNPVFRLAGKADIIGAREVTGITVYVGDYAELAKIAGGKSGAADRSVRYDLSVVRNHGEELPANLTIDVSVPREHTPDLSNKAMLIRMDNKLKNSGDSLSPAYVLSNRNIFAGR